MPFLRKEKNDIILDFKLFRLRLNTKKKYINSSNKIIVVNNDGNETVVDSYAGININFKDNNSTVKLYKGTKFSNCKMSVRKNCNITIGHSQYKIKNLSINTENNTTINIGKDFSCISASFFSDNEQNKTITIGEDCMLSSGITIRTSDGHRIYDIETKEILNYGEDVVIGNHVWVGPSVRILKGTHIADNSIIGADSLVNKKFTEENTIIAGTPAKIVRRGTNWDRKPPGSEVPIKEYRKEIK